ncbi:MAG: DMT family transporter [Bilophila wadsworthia]
MTVSKNVLMALLILSYATWGGGMIAMKYAFESFTAMQVVFARVAFAGVIYLALYRLWSHIPYQKGDWKYLLAMVLFEPCLFFLCETFAMTYTTASQGGVIAACFPLCTAVAAWLFLGEKLTKKTIIAMLLAVAGVAGASLAAESSDQASNPILGNLLMVGAVLSRDGLRRVRALHFPALLLHRASQPFKRSAGPSYSCLSCLRRPCPSTSPCPQSALASIWASA